MIFIIIGVKLRLDIHKKRRAKAIEKPILLTNDAKQGHDKKNEAVEMGRGEIMGELRPPSNIAEMFHPPAELSSETK